MIEDEFKKLVQRIVEMYQILPDPAAELLQRILRILADNRQEDELE